MHVPFLRDGARSTIALVGIMIGSCYAGGLRPDSSAAARRISETSDIQSVHFSESLNGTDTATVMEAGGFKLTASCKTITYTYDSFYGGYSSSSTSMHTFPSSYYSSSSFHHSGRMSSFHGSHHSRHPYGSHSSDNFGSPQGGWYGGGGGGGGGGGDDGRGGDGNPSSFRSFDSSMSSHNPQPVPGGGDGSGPRDGSSGALGDGSSSYSVSSTTPISGPPAGGGKAGREMNDDWSTHTTDDSGHDGYSKHTDGDDGSYSYHFREEYSHTEAFAALELTYTASDEDYLYGTPSYSNYPNETLVAGSYESGESRTQIVFAGRDGSWGDTCTMQSMSGNYVSIGQSTVGVHRSWMEGIGGGGWVEGIETTGDLENTNVFPDGVDCMVAGVVTFTASDHAY